VSERRVEVGQCRETVGTSENASIPDVGLVSGRQAVNKPTSVVFQGAVLKSDDVGTRSGRRKTHQYPTSDLFQGVGAVKKPTSVACQGAVLNSKDVGTRSGRRSASIPDVGLVSRRRGCCNVDVGCVSARRVVVVRASDGITWVESNFALERDTVKIVSDKIIARRGNRHLFVQKIFKTSY